MNDISQKLREICADIRRKPYPISNIIPVIQGAADEIERLIKDAERLQESLGLELDALSIFVARLENMQKNGDHWLTVAAVLALLNDCQYLAHLSVVNAAIAAGSQTDVCGNEVPSDLKGPTP